jgi:Tfp pilus assembly PilM family ATPase
MALFSFSKKILGIDIGSVNTKIVEVVKNKNDFEVVNFGIIPIVNFKEIVSYSYILEENLAAIISEFLKKAKVSTREVIFKFPKFQKEAFLRLLNSRLKNKYHFLLKKLILTIDMLSLKTKIRLING